MATLRALAPTQRFTSEAGQGTKNKHKFTVYLLSPEGVRIETKIFNTNAPWVIISEVILKLQRTCQIPERDMPEIERVFWAAHQAAQSRLAG